jgi:hypothetical protein
MRQPGVILILPMELAITDTMKTIQFICLNTVLAQKEELVGDIVTGITHFIIRLPVAFNPGLICMETWGQGGIVGLWELRYMGILLIATIKPFRCLTREVVS